MGKHYFQCAKCGKIHQVEMEYNIDSEETYSILYCEQCEDETRQLWCGENPEDRYIYYDFNNDPRYYLYY